MRKTEAMKALPAVPAPARVKAPRNEMEALRIVEHAGMLIVKGWILLENETEN